VRPTSWLLYGLGLYWLSIPNLGLTDSLASDEPTVEVVDRSIEYHGGSRFRNTRTRLEVCSRSGCYEVSAAVQGSRYQYSVRGPFRDGVREVVMNNDRVAHWHNGVEAPPRPEDEQALRDWAMARLYFCFLPYRLDDESVIKQDLGLENWSGRSLHKVRVTFVPGSSTDAEDEFIYWFDPGNGRLEQFAYSFRGSPGGLRFRRLYNYRRVGGILFHDQENWGASGDDLRVDRIDPEFASSMQRISAVEVDNIRVEDLRGKLN
jgi:hypothetical protein